MSDVLRHIPHIPSVVGSPSPYGPQRQAPKYPWNSHIPFWTFSFGLWRTVVLRQVLWVAPDFPSSPPDEYNYDAHVQHFYSSKEVGQFGAEPPLTPSWWSVYHNYSGTDAIDELHDTELDPLHFPWVLTYNKFSSHVFSPGPDAIHNTLVLYRAKSSTSPSGGVVDRYDDLIWYLPRESYAESSHLFLPSIPLTLVSASDEDSITLRPL